MKRMYIFCLLIIFISFSFSGCKKDDTPNPDDFSGNSGTFKDSRDGISYAWVKIGKQIWMAQNLDFEVASGTWYYSSNSELSGTYGRLYTHEAALLAIPEGWHLPTVTELDSLSTYLGGAILAGGKLKQSETSNWLAPNTGADNSTGFNALPGGLYDPGDGFFEKGNSAFFWTSTYAEGGGNVRYYYLNYNDAGLHYNDATDPALGFSVRCI